jgi:hypothetical protein
MNRRATVGLIAIGLLAAGITLWLANSGEAGAAFIRVGMVMLAVWLAYRDMQRIPVWMLGAGLMGLAIVAWRPKLIIIVLPVLIAFWFLRPRATRSPDAR